MKIFTNFSLHKRFIALVVVVVCCLIAYSSLNLVTTNLVPRHIRKNASIYVNRDTVRRNVSSLGKYPTELDTHNIYWQVLNVSNSGTFWMLNAYYDNRAILADKPLIRILTYIKWFNPKTNIFCQLWFDDLIDIPIVVKAEFTLVWYHGKSGAFNPKTAPYLVNCPNPLATGGLIPTSVSLVESKTDDARNNLRIIYNVPTEGKKKFVAVCTKDLEYPDKDISLQLIEWIEIVHLLGADKVFLYVVKVHPNTMKVLKHFEAQGKVKIEMVTVPRGFPGKHGSTEEAYQQEMVSLNDCLYKHMHEYEFILPIDTDEFIVPSKDEDKTWLQMINRVKKNLMYKKPCSFVALNVYFLEDNNHENETQSEIPSDLYFLQHVYRAKYFSEPDRALKSFQSTEYVIVSQNHLPWICSRTKGPQKRYIGNDIGKLHHYRRGCGPRCTEEMYENYTQFTVKDLTLWKYKGELIANVNKTLDDLKSENLFF